MGRCYRRTASRFGESRRHRSPRERRSAARTAEVGGLAKHVFVTGGVASSLGKGLTASSLGRLLKSRGLRVTMQKLDPYINVDPGTMNPFQHGEVFVTDDKGETDLDLGHYERFVDVAAHPALERHHRLDLPVGARQGAQGRVPRRDGAGDPAHHQRDQGAHPRARHRRRRRRDHRGRRHRRRHRDPAVPRGDPAVPQGRRPRQRLLRARHARAVHRPVGASRRPSPPSTRSPSCAAAASSPTRSCAAATGRSPKRLKEKISALCDVPEEGIVSAVDAEILYEIPLVLHDEGLDDYVCRVLHLDRARARPHRVARARRPGAVGRAARCTSGSSASTSTFPTRTSRSSRR